MESIVKRDGGAREVARRAAARSADAAVSPTTRLAAMLKEALAANTIGGKVDDDSRYRAADEEVRQAQANWSRIGPVPDEVRARARRSLPARDPADPRSDRIDQDESRRDAAGQPGAEIDRPKARGLTRGGRRAGQPPRSRKSAATLTYSILISSTSKTSMPYGALLPS